MTPRTFDEAAQDLFTAEGAPSLQDPSPGSAPPLRLACPAEAGAAQRYRMPLWRRFTKPAHAPERKR